MEFVPSDGMPPPPPPPPAGAGMTSVRKPRWSMAWSRCGSAATSSRRVKIRDVKPIYPPIAQAARRQGVVIIEAVIDAAGNVARASVLRGQPLLDQAALDAVKQWQFEPTHINGVPTPVIMTVTVNFTLQ